MLDRNDLWAVIWQGALLAPLLLVLAAGAVALWFRVGWERHPAWREAWRHAHTPWMAIQRWIIFRWIHFDCLYWVLPVRLDRGPLRLEGRPPEGVYWSITWYSGPTPHPSVSSETVVLGPDGRYCIHIGGPQRPRNWIPAEAGARKGVLYMRVYEPPHLWPTPLPDVYRGDLCLARGGLL